MRTFAVALLALALTACGQQADDPIPHAHEVRTSEVETPDAVAETPKPPEAPTATPGAARSTNHGAA